MAQVVPFLLQKLRRIEERVLRLALHLCALLAFFTLACNWTTTRELLDLTFLEKIARKFQLTSPSLIEAGTPFNVVVVYTDTNGGKSAGRFADYLNWEVVGAGSLTQTAPGTITSGVYQATLIYSNSALTQGQSTSIVLKVTDPNNGAVSGISGSVTARFPVTLNTFKFSAPQLAYQNTGFTITISATATDGSVYSAYNGTVNLTPTVTGMTTADGTLTPATATFTNGVATVSNVQYTKPAGSLYITATDTSGTGKTGTSNGIQLAGDAFSLLAIPIDTNSDSVMDAVRISWTKPLNVFDYIILRETTPGVFTPIVNSPKSNAYTSTTDSTGLALGQTYNYRVIARDNSGNTLKSGDIQVLFKSCGTTYTGSFSTGTTNWTLGNSPYCIGTTALPNVTVTVDGTLTIDPGVLILNASGASFNVSTGTLMSKGTVNQPIIFTSNALNPTAPAWGGITVNSGAVQNNLSVTMSIPNPTEAASETNGTTGSTLSYTVIEYSKAALVAVRQMWIENSLIRLNANNNSFTNEAAGIRINCAAGEWVVMRNNAFIQNSNASGTSATDLISVTGKFVLRNNTFQGSVASNSGGAMYLTSPGIPTISGNAFYSTNGTNGGAMYLNGGSGIFIRNNLFSGTYAGAAGALALNSTAVVTDNTFDTTLSAGSSGGINSGANNTNISNNIFKNTSCNTGDGGSLWVNANSNVITGNVFISSKANNTGVNGTGGAISINGSSNSVQYNSFYSTYATKYGGAIGLNGSSGNVISFNHFYNTTSFNLGGAIYAWNPGETGLVISHNNFIGTQGRNTGYYPQVLYSVITADYTVSNNWWGSDYSAVTSCQSAPALCETTVASKPTLLNNRTGLQGAWPLCCAAPSDITCVGATTLPASQTCQ